MGPPLRNGLSDFYSNVYDLFFRIIDSIHDTFHFTKAILLLWILSVKIFLGKTSLALQAAKIV